MKITLKPVLWDKKADKQGLCPIAISISGGGKRIYHNTGIKVLPGHWLNGKILKGHKNYDIQNGKIEGMISDCTRELLNRELQGGEVTLEIAKKLLDPDKVKKGTGFVPFYKEYIELLRSRHTPGYIRHFEVEYRMFIAHDLVKGSIPFSDITAEFLERFEMSLKGKPNTINTKMKRLKDVINRAIDRGLMEKKQIAGYKFPKYQAPERQYLTLKEIEKIEKAIYGGDFKDSPGMQKTACFFLVECLSSTRFSDWRRFSVETLVHNRSFKIGMTQKNKQPVYLPLDKFKSLARILDYITDNGVVMDMELQPVNRLLKDLAKYCEIDKELTTHLGRHTFATMAAEKGYSTTWIAQAMGVSENTAKTYRKITAKALSRETDVIGGW